MAPVSQFPGTFREFLRSDFFRESIPEGGIQELQDIYLNICRERYNDQCKNPNLDQISQACNEELDTPLTPNEVEQLSRYVNALRQPSLNSKYLSQLSKESSAWKNSILASDRNAIRQLAGQGVKNLRQNCLPFSDPIFPLRDPHIASLTPPYASVPPEDCQKVGGRKRGANDNWVTDLITEVFSLIKQHRQKGPFSKGIDGLEEKAILIRLEGIQKLHESGQESRALLEARLVREELQRYIEESSPYDWLRAETVAIGALGVAGLLRGVIGVIAGGGTTASGGGPTLTLIQGGKTAATATQTVSAGGAIGTQAAAAGAVIYMQGKK